MKILKQNEDQQQAGAAGKFRNNSEISLCSEIAVRISPHKRQSLNSKVSKKKNCCFLNFIFITLFYFIIFFIFIYIKKICL